MQTTQAGNEEDEEEGAEAKKPAEGIEAEPPQKVSLERLLSAVGH